MGNKHSGLSTIKACAENRTVLITGANSGLGYATAVRFANLGSKVICATRDDIKGAETVAKIQDATQNKNVHFVSMDLNDLSQVKLAADKVLAEHGELHHLINNAGFGMWDSNAVRHLNPISAQNIETHFQVNYLSHFYLTQLLLPLMASSVTDQAQSRITNVTSKAHFFLNDASKFNSHVPDDVSEFYNPMKGPHGELTLPSILTQGVEQQEGQQDQPALTMEQLQELKYYSTHAYAFSKMSLIMFTFGLQRALDAMNSPIAVNAIHPGAALTHFYDNFGNPQVLQFLKTFRMLKKPEEISKYIVWASTEPNLNEYKGEYFNQTRMAKPNALAQNEDMIERLWRVSEQLVEQRGTPLETSADTYQNTDENTEQPEQQQQQQN